MQEHRSNNKHTRTHMNLYTNREDPQISCTDMKDGTTRSSDNHCRAHIGPCSRFHQWTCHTNSKRSFLSFRSYHYTTSR